MAKKKYEGFWHKPNAVISKLNPKRPIAMLVGPKGSGKTFGYKLEIVDRYLKNKKIGLWLRRYATEIPAAMEEFMTDLQIKGFYTQMKTMVKMVGKVGYLYELVESERIPICKFIAVADEPKLRGIPFPIISIIVFDEFIIPVDNKKQINYCNNEVEHFLILMDSICRLEFYPIILVGNAISQVNPYTVAWGITFKPGVEWQYYKVGESNVVVHWYQNDKYQQAKANSSIGKLMANTDYGNMATFNQFQDNMDFIEDKGSSAEFKCNIQHNGNLFGVWVDYTNNSIYIDKPVGNGRTYNLTDKDQMPNTVLLHTITAGKIFEISMLIKFSSGTSRLKYKDIQTKVLFKDALELMKLRGI